MRLNKEMPIKNRSIVTSSLHGCGVVTYLSESHVQVMFKGYDFPVTYLQGSPNNDILHIRPPRKGSKDAREIVWMLARAYHDDIRGLLKLWKSTGETEDDVKYRITDYWRVRKRGGFNEQNIIYLLYLKAKSKLK